MVLHRARKFGLFLQDERGEHLEEFFDDLELAVRKAQELAISEGSEYFVFSFRQYREIGRFLPPPSRPQLAH